MWFARIGSTAPFAWHMCLHVPLDWKGSPEFAGFTPQMHHLPQIVKDKARLAFPIGDLFLIGVYYSTKGDDQ